MLEWPRFSRQYLLKTKMFKRIILMLKTTALCTAALLAFVPLGAMAQEDRSGENIQVTDADQEAGGVGKIALAQELFDHATQNRDAVAALAAAQIMATVSTEDVEREKTTEDNPDLDITEDGSDGADSPATADSMFAAAMEFAGGDPTIVGLVEDAMAEGSRGRIGGASRTLSRLPGGQVDIFTVPFFGGSFAEVGIIGDGDSDLDLLVTDENGNVICRDTRLGDQIYCSFTPRWNGNFVIAVANMGRVRNSYYILTN